MKDLWDKFAYWVCESDIIKLIKGNGATHNTILSCKKCGTKNEYAEPNQPDNTYICYGCRS